MAILDEYVTYGPNMTMLAIGLGGMVSAMIWTVVLRFSSDATFSQKEKRVLGLIVLVLWILSAGCALSYNKPEFQTQVGKKQIVATFALGHPNAYVLQKYDVVGMKDYKTYILEEK